MTLQLGSLTLNANMIWVEQHQVLNISQEAPATTGGGVVVFFQQIKAGIPITLQATDEQGWVNEDQKTQLIAMASLPGQVYDLVIGNSAYRVMFRHQESPAVDLEPFISRLVPESGDHYQGTIKLMTV